MTHFSIRLGVTSTVLLAALLGLAGLDRLFPEWAARLHASRLLDIMQRKELNQEAIAQQTAGYYEGLLNEGSRVSSVNTILSGRLQMGGRSRNTKAHATIRALRQPDRYLRRGDFLYYEALPNLDVPDYDDSESRLVTNSVGMSDKEYQLEKPSGVRRLAVLGDSVTRGMGAPFGSSYEALLERHLQGEGSGGTSFEVLNFAVGGYRMTQVLDVVAEKASRYRPDVYIIGITELTISRRWADHLEELVASRVDLKYDFLREVVAQAGLRGGESLEIANAKLARFRLPLVRRILEEIRNRAASQQAGFMAVLVPTVREVGPLREEFEGITEILAELNIPTVDLLDSFRDVDDLNGYRVSGDNFHPNGPGHRRLFERLYEAIRSDPGLSKLVFGLDAPGASAEPLTER